MDLTIDAFAWIEILRGSTMGKAAVAALASAGECFTASVSLAEVAHFALTHGIPAARAWDRLAWISEATRNVPIDPRVATAAALATRGLKARARSRGVPPPGLADGIVLASARETGSRVLTGDWHLEGLPETRWLS